MLNHVQHDIYVYTHTKTNSHPELDPGYELPFLIWIKG